MVGSLVGPAAGLLLYALAPCTACSLTARPALATPSTSTSGDPLTCDVAGLQCDRLLVLLDGRGHLVLVEESVAQRIVHLRGCYECAGVL